MPATYLLGRHSARPACSGRRWRRALGHPAAWAGLKGPVLLRTRQRCRCCTRCPTSGPTMFFMLLGAPVPFWYELQTSDGEVYAKMPVLKTCRDACCSLFHARLQDARGGQGTERVNVQIASRARGAVMAPRGSTVSPSKRAKAPSNRLIAQAHLPELHELLSNATSMAKGTELFAPTERRHRCASPTSLLTTTPDLTDRNLYKKMSGPTKTCSVQGTGALQRPARSRRSSFFAIEKFFFAMDGGSVWVSE